MHVEQRHDFGRSLDQETGVIMHADNRNAAHAVGGWLTGHQ
jgi:hypothetical protein